MCLLIGRPSKDSKDLWGDQSQTTSIGWDVPILQTHMTDWGFSQAQDVLLAIGRRKDDYDSSCLDAQL